jgi:hypothetical protein
MKVKPPALAALLVVIGACMTIGSAESQAADKSNSPSNPFDPCVLVTTADLQVTFGIAFTQSAHADNGESRICQFDGPEQSFLVMVYTGNKELSEFQSDAKDALKKKRCLGNDRPDQRCRLACLSIHR